MTSVLIVANCHSMSLSRSLALTGRNLEVSFIDLNFLSRAHEVAQIERLSDGPPDLVFTLHTKPRFGKVATGELRALLGERVRTFTNIHFNGLHPDIIYVGSPSHRKLSPLGAYHSGIILYCYLQGYSEADCRAMFNGQTYERLGYYDAFDAAKVRLLAREDSCDIKFAEQFLSMLKSELCLYTVNHPTGAVFHRLTEQLCEAASIEFIDYSDRLSINDLSNNYIWPVYNEIAEANRLSYRVPQFFVNHQSFSSRSLSLEEMIAGSFQVYARMNKVHLLGEAVEFSSFKEYEKRLS